MRGIMKEIFNMWPKWLWALNGFGIALGLLVILFV